MMDILPSLQKGALLAQHSARIDEIKELDDDDREVIRREKTRMSCPLALWENALRTLELRSTS